MSEHPTLHDDLPVPGGDTPRAPAPPSRRAFLGLIGAGVGAAVAVPAIAAAQTAEDDRPRREDRRDRGDGPGDRDGRDGRDVRRGVGPGPATDGPDRFARMFDRPPFAEPSAELRAALTELGRPGGMMDAGDPVEVGPIRLITEPELSPKNRDNSANTAGVTFMGQFLDHDITRDAGSRLGEVTPARRSTNLRSARFDLDSVYGGGPDGSAQLHDGFRLRIESGGQFEDLLRDDDGSAVLGHDRNDVFDPDSFGSDDPDDLTGRSRAPRRFIGWQTFFDFGDGAVKPSKRIDTVMSTPLFQLPMFAIPMARGEDIGPTSLATRNLLRHITWEIPSGQRVAAELGVDRLSAADLSDVGQL